MSELSNEWINVVLCYTTITPYLSSVAVHCIDNGLDFLFKHTVRTKKG